MQTLNEKQRGAIDPIIGLDARHLGWAPSLRYLLRRARVLALLRPTDQKPELLEIGCGAGALLFELSYIGYTCTGVETSRQALDVATKIASMAPNPPLITSTLDPDWDSYFDALLSLDVLEHIEDDGAALKQWAALLKPGGRMVLSVPAHQHRWSNGDIWAGHFRRYDRNQLIHLVEKAGLTVSHIECYGYPLANITEWVGNFYYWYRLKLGASTKKPEATAASGVNRQFYARIGSLLRGWVGKAIIKQALKAQNSRLEEDVGSGYILVAQKA